MTGLLRYTPGQPRWCSNPIISEDFGVGADSATAGGLAPAVDEATCSATCNPTLVWCMATPTRLLIMPIAWVGTDTGRGGAPVLPRIVRRAEAKRLLLFLHQKRLINGSPAVCWRRHAADVPAPSAYNDQQRVGCTWSGRSNRLPRCLPAISSVPYFCSSRSWKALEQAFDHDSGPVLGTWRGKM